MLNLTAVYTEIEAKLSKNFNKNYTNHESQSNFSGKCENIKTNKFERQTRYTVKLADSRNLKKEVYE